MTDRELLELAAKAVGLSLEQGPGSPPEKCLGACLDGGTWDYWNPLDDDGDALRLAVKLNMTLIPSDGRNMAWAHSEMISRAERNQVYQAHDGDTLAALRRAIVRAAAEIGRAM